MTDKKRRGLDLALCLGAGLFYLLNVHVLRGSGGGAPGWFLACYANDIFAGLAICAWLDLLLSLGRLPPPRAPPPKLRRILLNRGFLTS